MVSSKGIKIKMTRDELMTLPNRQYFEKKFLKDGQDTYDLTLSNQEFQLLKFSFMPSVRSKYFNEYSNNCKPNTANVLQMIRMRQQLALEANHADYFSMKVS